MATLWLVGSLSFVVALSGALMPGPLLTFTVARTVRTPRRGWLTGALVIAGHAALEGAIVVGLLFGVLEFLRTPVALKVIGTVGGVFLAWSGIAMLVGLRRADGAGPRRRHRAGRPDGGIALRPAGPGARRRARVDGQPLLVGLVGHRGGGHDAALRRVVRALARPGWRSSSATRPAISRGTSRLDARAPRTARHSARRVRRPARRVRRGRDRVRSVSRRLRLGRGLRRNPARPPCRSAAVSLHSVPCSPWCCASCSPTAG